MRSADHFAHDVPNRTDANGSPPRLTRSTIGRHVTVSASIADPTGRRSMIARTLRITVAVILLAAGLFIGARPIGPAPALGAFLDPAHGVWSLARSATISGDARATLASLGDSVSVVYDDRAVPHIFAKSDADAYRALGYVVARDRLFQLYVQTLAASG